MRYRQQTNVKKGTGIINSRATCRPSIAHTFPPLFPTIETLSTPSFRSRTGGIQVQQVISYRSLIPEYIKDYAPLNQFAI
jgi:hypothetical protein